MNLSGLTPVLATITVIGVIPVLAVLVTSFTKITLILLILRNAIGIQQTPPNIVVFSVAIILSMHIMQPVLTASAERLPLEKLPAMSIAELSSTAMAAAEPFKQFMVQNSEAGSREFFANSIQKRAPGSRIDETAFMVVIPAFLMDELAEAFHAGLMIYIPFIVIDLVVSAILIALGMQMMSVTAIATPLKILLFIQVQGWIKIFDMLLLSYK